MTEQDRDFYQRLRDRYETETSLPPDGLDVPDAYDYIRYKAFVFLALGSEAYRRGDALGQPPEGWSQVLEDRVRLGCRQLLNWHGLAADRPLDGIGIGAFYAMMRLFHFRCRGQAALTTDQDPGYFYDRMSMVHVVQGDELVLFNRVPAPGMQGYAEAPCPYCGAPLRTPRARQCRACGTDWHDPANVTSIK